VIFSQDWSERHARASEARDTLREIFRILGTHRGGMPSGMKLRRFAALPGTDRLRLAQALVLLVTVGIGLRVVAFRRLWRLLEAWARCDEQPGESDGIEVRRVAWAIAVASRYVPGAGRCLPQALVAHALLRREGLASRVWLGLARRVDGDIEGHAWVEIDGWTVIGGRDVDRYRPIALEATLG
jgi:transglutaminase superfamily protein